MRANDLSADELAEALSRGASGMDTCEAAIRLLVAHGVWPVRLAAARFVELSDEDEPEEPRYVQRRPSSDVVSLGQRSDRLHAPAG